MIAYKVLKRTTSAKQVAQPSCNCIHLLGCLEKKGQCSFSQSVIITIYDLCSAASIKGLEAAESRKHTQTMTIKICKKKRKLKRQQKAIIEGEIGFQKTWGTSMRSFLGLPPGQLSFVCFLTAKAARRVQGRIFLTCRQTCTTLRVLGKAGILSPKDQTEDARQTIPRILCPGFHFCCCDEIL